jgi:HAMP domain-containing protein
MRAQFDAFIATEHGLAQAQEDRSDQAARRAVAAAVGGLLISVLLALAFAGYLTRAIVRPVVQAAQMAVQLAGGNLGTRMPTTGMAEIGQLERAFNDMAGSLERHRDDLAELAAEQAALRRVATLVARGVSPDDLFTRVAEEVGTLLGADLTTMVRFGTDRAELVAEAGDTIGLVPVGTTWDRTGPWTVTQVWQTGRSARFDGYEDTDDPAGESARRVGIRSSVGSPIVVEGRRWGRDDRREQDRAAAVGYGATDGGLQRARRRGHRQRRGARRTPADGRGAVGVASGGHPGRPGGLTVGGVRSRHPGGRPALRRRPGPHGAL